MSSTRTKTMLGLVDAVAPAEVPSAPPAATATAATAAAAAPIATVKRVTMATYSPRTFECGQRSHRFLTLVLRAACEPSVPIVSGPAEEAERPHNVEAARRATTDGARDHGSRAAWGTRRHTGVRGEPCP